VARESFLNREEGGRKCKIKVLLCPQIYINQYLHQLVISIGVESGGGVLQWEQSFAHSLIS